MHRTLTRRANRWVTSAALAMMLAAPAVALTTPAAAVEGVGTVTGLPLPRYVSLKPSDTPMREGPSKDNRVKWVFKREGLPLEIISEYETWRRVRDSEGVDGWVYHGRLSGRRTALVTAAAKEPTVALRARANETGDVVARLQPGVIASVEACDGRWCRLRGEGFDGWMAQERLWGVYPGEQVK